MTIYTYNSDNLEVIDLLKKNEFKLIFIDPPYNITNFTWDNWNFNDYLKPFNRIVDGYFACFGPFEMLAEMVVGAESDRLFSFCFDYAWVKNTFPMTRLVYKKPSYQHEMIVVMTNTDNPVFNHVKKLAKREVKKYNRKVKKSSEYMDERNFTGFRGSYMFDNKGEGFTSTVLYGPRRANLPEKEMTKHPTQKPLSVVGHVIQALTNKGDWILDCFAGSGTTAVAAKMLDRNCVAIERDKKYYNIMMDRLESTEKVKQVSHKDIKKLL